MARVKKAVETILDKPAEPVVAEDVTESPREPLAAPEQVPAHPLDSAPFNSKIVVTADGAILAMSHPATEDAPARTEIVTLVRPDPAARLPVGAKISKVRSADGETFYVATLLNSERVEEPTIHDSALEAIRLFPETHYNR